MPMDATSEGVEFMCSYMHERILGLAGDFQHGSLVVVDKGFGELFEAGIGVQTFLGMYMCCIYGGNIHIKLTCMHVDLGATGILSLEEWQSMEKLELWVSSLACLTKRNRFSNVLFFCSSLLINCADKVVRFATVLPNYADRITILSIVSEAAHHDADPNLYSETDCFQELEQHFHMKIGDKTAHAFDIRIKHMDIPCFMVGKSTFVFPRRCGASFVPDEASTEAPEDIEGKVMMNAHMISSVSRILDVQPEAFCLGALSERVARALSFIPAHDSSSGKRAAFCIVDRALDTMSPSVHSDYFIQRMMVHNYECQSTTDMPVRDSVFHPADVGSTAYLEFLMSKTNKEAMLFLRKWLKEAIRESNMKFNGRLKPGAPSVEDLEALSTVLLSDSSARTKYASLLQIVNLACKCVKSDKRWEESKKLEEISRLSAEDGPDSLCSFILDELAAACRGISESHSIFNSVKHLLIGSYCMKINPYLQGNQSFSMAQRASMAQGLAEVSERCMHMWQERGTLANSIEKEMPWISKKMRDEIVSLHGDVSTIPLQEICSDVVETICNVPSQYQSGTGDPPGPHEQTLVIKFIEDILADRNITAMKHIGTSIAGLLKSGLGRIGLQQHNPGEYEMIVIFILGGISINEISQTRAYIDQSIAQMQSEGRHLPQIILGASSILTTPEVTLQSIFS